MVVLFSCIQGLSGGGVSYTKNLSLPLYLEFKKSGKHKILFLVHEDQRETISAIPLENIKFIKGARPKGVKRLIWEHLHLRKIAKENDCEVVFIPYQIGPYLRGFKNLLMIRNMEPFLFKGYGYDFKSRLRNIALSILSNRSLGRADRIIAVSKFARRHLFDIGVGNKKISLIRHGKPVPNALQLQGISSSDVVDDKCLFFIACGSMLPYRRHEDVISAFENVCKTTSADIHLYIAGSGTDASYEAKIAAQISNSPFNSRIKNLGQVSNLQLLNLLSKSIACVIASEIEACPNIALEALALGCPIVSTNTDPMPEILADSGSFFRARDINDLSDKLIQVLQNEDFRVNLAKQSLVRARDFSWTKCASETYVALTSW